MGQKAGLLILSAWLALMSAQVSALGLGAISLKSNLNQPLSAEIELLEVRGLTESEVLVSLASQDDFDRVGVDRNYFLTDLSFDVDLTSNNGPIVKINSTKVVREPYLNFVILVRWPSGKLLREYTVLMDLPIYSEDAPAPINSAQASSPASQQVRASSLSRDNSRSAYNTPANTTSQSSSGGSGSRYTGSTYEVAPEDTLWEIALEVRPDNSVSVHQTMLAIQVANPDAFINNNINLLKKGQILRIPERDSMASVNQRQAVVEVKDQIQRWSGNDDATAAPLASSSSFSSPNKTASSTEGRVKLSAPEENFGSEQGSGSGSSENTSSEALARELSGTLEELDKTSRENNELRSKVQALEEQIKTMERMIEVGNEDLRSMELAAKAREEGLALARKAEAEGLAMARKAEEEALAAAAEAERLANEAQSQQGNLATEPENTNAAVATPKPTATPKPVATPTPKPAPEKAKKPAVTSAPAAEPKGIIDLLLDNILYVGLGLILILAIGGFLIQRKLSNDDDDEFLDLDDEDFPDDDEAFEELTGNDEFALDTDTTELQTEDEVFLEPQIDEEVIAEKTEEAEPETEDVVAEADIYIAYGKYDQAEEMLLKAIDKDPGFHEARLKLLESYAAGQDIERFDPHFAKLVAVGSSDLTNRAERLRTSINDAPEFNPHDFDTSEFEELVGASSETEIPAVADMSDNVSELDDFDLDLDFNDSMSDIDSTEDATLDTSLELDDVAFDLDGLDIDEGDTSKESTAESDFDLDLDENFDVDDLNLDDIDESLDSSAPADDLELDLSSLDASLDDDLSLDADLSLDDDLSLDADLSLDDDLSLDADLSLDDDLSLDTDLSLDDDLSLDSDLSDVEASELSTDEESSSISLDDDLSLDDLDLSALDDELEAMSKDLDGDLDSDDLLEGGLAETASLGDELEDLDLDAPNLDLSDLDSPDLDSPDLDSPDLDSTLGSDDQELPVDDLSETIELDDLDFDLDNDFDELDVAAKEADAAPEPTETFSRLDTSVDFTLPDIDPDSVEDDDLDFLSDSDETATKLDLARAYIDMGDAEGARDIIDEIIKEGSEQHKADAESLLARLDS